ncbi:MAG: ABC transporter ATP-binding protein [Firmicutes bacterium]|nr:ABC transporter ATP-binding protein [Bacillota bacterium]
MIDVKNLKKSYKDQEVLKDINFKISKGEIYGFLGQNGAGKSTTMNILTGLIKYNSGDITIAGFDMKKEYKKIINIIGYLPENPKFYPYMTGREYLKFICEIKGLDKLETSKKIDKLLELVKLNKASKRKIGGYSRGMRQRLGIAVSLINDPKILFLDEPSSALDPEGRKDVVKIIESLKSLKITIFLSTHILSDVERICDRIGILNEGNIVLEDSLERLKNKYILPVYDIEFSNNCEDLNNNFNKYDWIEKIKTNNKKMSIYVKNRFKADRKLLNIISNIENTVLSYKIRKSKLEEIFLQVVNNNE